MIHVVVTAVSVGTSIFFATCKARLELQNELQLNAWRCCACTSRKNSIVTALCLHWRDSIWICFLHTWTLSGRFEEKPLTKFQLNSYFFFNSFKFLNEFLFVTCLSNVSLKTSLNQIEYFTLWVLLTCTWCVCDEFYPFTQDRQSFATRKTQITTFLLHWRTKVRYPEEKYSFRQNTIVSVWHMCFAVVSTFHIFRNHRQFNCIWRHHFLWIK